MLQSEFETLTDIFPDVLLYEAAEKAYNEGNWASKAEFCECFRHNEDGIASKIQRQANSRWFSAEELIGALNAENEELRNEIAAITDRVDELTEEVSERVDTVQNIRAAICKAETMMLAEFSREDVGTAHIGFDYLLKALGVE